MDTTSNHGGSLGLDNLALEPIATIQHDQPSPFSHREKHLAAGEARRLGLTPNFRRQLQQQRHHSEDTIITSSSGEAQALEVLKPVFDAGKASQVRATVVRTAAASEVRNAKAGDFHAPSQILKPKLNGAAPAFIPPRSHDRGSNPASQKIKLHNAIPSYQALPIAPLGTRVPRVRVSQDTLNPDRPLVSSFRKVPPWRIDKWYRQNVYQIYQAQSIVPTGTRGPPISKGIPTSAITFDRLPSPKLGLPPDSQQARYSSMRSTPEPAPNSLRSLDEQTTSRKKRPLRNSQRTIRQSPRPNPSPRRQQTPIPAPTPTPQYLLQAEFNPKYLIDTQRLLLVLDLNGTLLCRNRSKVQNPRQNLKLFLAYCLAHHSVLIWSSATPPNVASVCARIFAPKQRQQLLGEWARDTLDLTDSEYSEKCQVYKRLERIWEGKALRDSHPDHTSGKRWSQANTLLLDDSVAKAQAQPYNLIEIPEFTTNETTERGKDYLGQVVAYVEEARSWSDVSAFAKRKRFRVDAGWAWDWKAGRKVEEDEDDGDGGVRL